MNELEKPDPILAPPGAPDFLVHNEGDQVGVAVHDVEPGPRQAVYMDSDRAAEITVGEAVPLGHKAALADIGDDVEVVEYGVVIGRSRGPIARGRMVHVHNLRSARWEASE